MYVNFDRLSMKITGLYRLTRNWNVLYISHYKLQLLLEKDNYFPFNLMDFYS